MSSERKRRGPAFQLERQRREEERSEAPGIGGEALPGAHGEGSCRAREVHKGRARSASQKHPSRLAVTSSEEFSSWLRTVQTWKDFGRKRAIHEQRW